MGLADLCGIADLHCKKVKSTKWLKYKLRAMIGGQWFEQTDGRSGFLFPLRSVRGEFVTQKLPTLTSFLFFFEQPINPPKLTFLPYTKSFGSNTSPKLNEHCFWFPVSKPGFSHTLLLCWLYGSPQGIHIWDTIPISRSVKRLDFTLEWSFFQVNRECQGKANSLYL